MLKAKSYKQLEGHLLFPDSKKYGVPSLLHFPSELLEKMDMGRVPYVNENVQFVLL
jgi:hypothetical protein